MPKLVSTKQTLKLIEALQKRNIQVILEYWNGHEDRIVRQVRMVCIVEPYGDFEADPDGDIVEIKFIDPKDYKQYFDWGEIGGYIMNKAIEINNHYLAKI